MLVELGNHACLHAGIDDRPKVTRIHIPEFDEHGLGGYTHTPGQLTAAEFQREIREAEEYRGGIYRLPGHEAALAVRNAWRAQAGDRPAWLQVSGHPDLGTPKTLIEDLEGFLHEHFETGGERKPADVEQRYWTPNGAPGEDRGLQLPSITGLYTDDGRAMNNNNDGGDALQSLMMGTGSAATATTLTTSNTLVTNATAGHRIYVYSTTSNNFVWGNCISNTNAASASVVTVDQWYVPLTPGGAVGTVPTTPWAWVLVDGGMVSTWFAALATGANAPLHGDHTLSTNGNVEYVQAGGTLIRKICPTATTSGVATRTVTLVPVFTANSTDVPNLPKVFTTAGFFASMVVSFGGAGGPMKFETAMNASATVAALNDQVTLTETISGS